MDGIGNMTTTITNNYLWLGHSKKFKVTFDPLEKFDKFPVALSEAKLLYGMRSHWLAFPSPHSPMLNS